MNNYNKLVNHCEGFAALLAVAKSPVSLFHSMTPSDLNGLTKNRAVGIACSADLSSSFIYLF